MEKKKQICPKCHATHYGNIEYCVCGTKLMSDVDRLAEQMGMNINDSNRQVSK